MWLRHLVVVLKSTTHQYNKLQKKEKALTRYYKMYELKIETCVFIKRIFIL